MLPSKLGFAVPLICAPDQYASLTFCWKLARCMLARSKVKGIGVPFWPCPQCSASEGMGACGLPAILFLLWLRTMVSDEGERPLFFWVTGMDRFSAFFFDLDVHPRTEGHEQCVCGVLGA